MKNTITILFISFFCCNLWGQTNLPGISCDEINKKEADAALTDSLSGFVCRNSAFTDSIYNSILGEYADNAPFVLSVIHRRYGSLPPAITITMRNLICMFINDFDIFFSVEESADDTVSITTVFSHKTLNFIHLLVAKTNIRDFRQTERPIKADFYSFVPQKLVTQ